MRWLDVKRLFNVNLIYLVKIMGLKCVFRLPISFLDSNISLEDFFACTTIFHENKEATVAINPLTRRCYKGRPFILINNEGQHGFAIFYCTFCYATPRYYKDDDDVRFHYAKKNYPPFSDGVQ